MSPARPARPARHHGSAPRLPTTLLLFAALTAIISAVLLWGPVTPSPGEVVPSIFMGAIMGGLLTVLIRSGFQQRPRWDDETPSR